MKVSAVVVSHGHAAELERSLPALQPQVDELLVIANVPGSVERTPDGVRVLENPRPLPLAANVNAGSWKPRRSATLKAQRWKLLSGSPALRLRAAAVSTDRPPWM